MSDSSFAPKTTPAIQGGVRYLLEQNSVAPEQLDGAGGGLKEGLISDAEFVHFVYESPEWQKYLQAIDKAGLKHPLDLHRLPEKIRTRIGEIKNKTERKIGLTPGDSGYCEAFVPAFYKEGLAPYEKGGLGFAHPFNYRGLETNEMTASEAYQAVLDPTNRKKEFGSCTEATHKIMAAFLAAGVPCRVDAVLTQNHLFARHGTYDLDPSGIGKNGWEKTLNAGQLAGLFYQNHALNNGSDNLPEAVTNFTTHLSKHRAFSDALSREDEPALFEVARSLIDANREDVSQITVVFAFIQSLPFEIRQSLRNQLMAAFPENPYVLWKAGQYGTLDDSLVEASEFQKTLAPHSGNAEYFLALENLRGEDSGAFAFYEQFLDEALLQNPDHPLALSLKAGLLLERGEMEKAEEMVRISMEKAPNLPGIYSLLAAIASLNNDSETAYRYAKKEALVFVGNDASGLLALAQTALMARKYDDAARIALDLLSQFPDWTPGYSVLFLALLSLGEMKEARSLAHHLMQKAQHPAEKATVAQQLGQIALRQWNFPEASRLFKMGVELYPTPGSAFYRDVMEIHRLEYEGRWEALPKAASDLKKRYPHQDGAYGTAANATMYLVPDQAQRDIEKGLALNPNSLAALFAQITLHWVRGETEPAGLLLEKLNRDFEGLPELLDLNGFHFYLTKDFAAAKKMALKGLKNNPHSLQARITLGLIAVEEGNFKKALRIAGEIEKFGLAIDTPHVLRARIHLARKKWKAAEEEAKKALKIFPYDPGTLPSISSRHLLIAALEGGGKTEEAAAARKALQENRQKFMPQRP